MLYYQILWLFQENHFSRPQEKQMTEESIDTFILKLDRRLARKLNRQRDKALRYIRHTMTRLNLRGLHYAHQIELCREMIRFVTKWKWLPDSYRKMLTSWNAKLDQGKGKDSEASKQADTLDVFGL